MWIVIKENYNMKESEVTIKWEICRTVRSATYMTKAVQALETEYKKRLTFGDENNRKLKRVRQ